MAFRAGLEFQTKESLIPDVVEGERLQDFISKVFYRLAIGGLDPYKIVQASETFPR